MGECVSECVSVFSLTLAPLLHSFTLVTVAITSRQDTSVTDYGRQHRDRDI
jgi:hypothetical protein